MARPKKEKIKKCYDENNNEIKNKAVPFKDGYFWKVKLTSRAVMANNFTSYLMAEIAANKYNEAVKLGKSKLTGDNYKKKSLKD